MEGVEWGWEVEGVRSGGWGSEERRVGVGVGVGVGERGNRWLITLWQDKTS